MDGTELCIVLQRSTHFPLPHSAVEGSFNHLLIYYLFIYLHKKFPRLAMSVVAEDYRGSSAPWCTASDGASDGDELVSPG